MYCGNITDHTCKEFYKENPDCHDCKKQKVMTNLRKVGETFYMEGNIVIGDLNDPGWVVVRGVRVDSCVDGKT